MKNLLRNVLKGRANRQYRKRGYHLFRAAFSPDQIDTIADLANRLIVPYRGEILRQEGGKLAANEFFPDTKIIRNSVFNPHLPLSEALEPLSAALRALITSPALADRLRTLDGAAHYTIQQTLLFFAAQTTGFTSTAGRWTPCPQVFPTRSGYHCRTSTSDQVFRASFRGPGAKS